MILKILAILVNTGDYFTTIIGFRYGCREANPIGKWLFKIPFLAFIVKIGFNFVIWYGNRYLLWACIILFGLCIINNIIKTIQMRRLLIWVKNQYNLSSLGEGLRVIKKLRKINDKNMFNL